MFSETTLLNNYYYFKMPKRAPPTDKPKNKYTAAAMKAISYLALWKKEHKKATKHDRATFRKMK